MNRQRSAALLFAALAITTIGSAPLAGQNKTAGPMRVVRKLPLGGDGRWDYLTVDANRLYIARATRFMVVNIEKGEFVGEIPDTPGAHGVAIATELGMGFTSNGQSNDVSVFDVKTLAVTKKIPTGQNPDAILYYAPTRSVFVFNGQSHSVSVIDAASLSVTATIPLAGKPEFAVADDHGNVYVNIADKNAITVIDAASRKVKGMWPLGSCEEPTGLSIDKSKSVLFASCGNQKLAVVDLSTGKVIQTVPIGDDCDATAFDPNKQLVFASNGEGSLTVIARDDRGSYHVQQTLATQTGSKTMALDSSSGRIYLPTGKFSGPPTQKPRPTLIPGTFEVWVIAE